MDPIRHRMSDKDSVVEHKVMLSVERLYALVVVFVVACATLLSWFRPQAVSSDMVGVVYGGALAFAGGRAATSRGALTRKYRDNDNGEER